MTGGMAGGGLAAIGGGAQACLISNACSRAIPSYEKRRPVAA
jgi:hypothetical protein